MTTEPSSNDPPHDAEPDGRLYVPEVEDWEIRLKRGWEKEYCYQQKPGEGFFHLLLSGEIYLYRDGEKYCLHCALRRGLVTRDRLHWQRRSPGR